MSLGAGCPRQEASTAAVRKVSKWRCCWVQVALTVKMRSTKVFPSALCAPKQPFRRITPPRSLREEPMHGLLDRHQCRLEQRAVDRPFAEQVPESKHQLAQCQEVGTPDPWPPAAINQRLKVANQMAPAQLVALWRQRQIGPMAIRSDDPAIRAAQQLAQRRPVPIGCHS